ncbi:unnamed protein product [Callosobruchus maculatus]|uniref:Uncharacterized protein n=1 Tax=Callosobruchus maculatus TaxID=64391 RepID=A0A653BFS7_CALMS|nr:unnamed protein product [Callosobruchus maculatus]
MDQQDKGFDVALYLNRITFDQLQKSPSQNKVAENTEWEQEVSDSLERFSITATIHNYSMAPTDLTDLELFLHDAELRELQRKVPIKKKIMQLFKTRRRRGSMTKDEFDNETDRLYKCCLRSCQDLHELHIRRLIGMEILKDIMQRVNISYVNAVNIMHIIWSIMSCMHHFQMRQKWNTYRIIQKSRQKKLDQCITIYSQLIEQLDVLLLRLALNAVMTFYMEGKLWDVDFNCMELISLLLNKFPCPEVGFNDIIRK